MRNLVDTSEMSFSFPVRVGAKGEGVRKAGRGSLPIGKTHRCWLKCLQEAGGELNIFVGDRTPPSKEPHENI